MIICTYNYKLTLSLDICRYMNELNSSVKYRYYYIGLHKAMYASCFLPPFNLLLFNSFNFKTIFQDNFLIIQLFLLIWPFIGVQVLVWNTAKNGNFLSKIACGTDGLLRMGKICNGCCFKQWQAPVLNPFLWQKCQMKPNPSSSHSSPIMLNKPPVVSHNPNPPVVANK